MSFSDTLRRTRELYTYRHEPEYMRPLGQIFWRALLVSSVAGAIGVVIYAGSVFWGVLHTLGSTSAAARPTTVLDRAALDALLMSIDARRADFEARKASSTPFVEPIK